MMIYNFDKCKLKPATTAEEILKKLMPKNDI